MSHLLIQRWKVFLELSCNQPPGVWAKISTNKTVLPTCYLSRFLQLYENICNVTSLYVYFIYLLGFSLTKVLNTTMEEREDWYCSQPAGGIQLQFTFIQKLTLNYFLSDDPNRFYSVSLSHRIQMFVERVTQCLIHHHDNLTGGRGGLFVLKWHHHAVIERNDSVMSMTDVC